MQEAKARLAVLLNVLLIFPKELLPLINDYVKSSVHKWSVSSISHSLSSDSKEPFCLINEKEAHNYSDAGLFVDSEYSSEDGPNSWIVETWMDSPINDNMHLFRGSYIGPSIDIAVSVSYDHTLISETIRNYPLIRLYVDLKRTKYCIKFDSATRSVALVKNEITVSQACNLPPSSHVRLRVRLHGESHVVLHNL